MSGSLEDARHCFVLYICKYVVSANEYSCAHAAQTNFEDPTPYLTYGLRVTGKWDVRMSEGGMS